MLANLKLFFIKHKREIIVVLAIALLAGLTIYFYNKKPVRYLTPQQQALQNSLDELDAIRAKNDVGVQPMTREEINKTIGQINARILAERKASQKITAPAAAKKIIIQNENTAIKI